MSWRLRRLVLAHRVSNQPKIFNTLKCRLPGPFIDRAYYDLSNVVVIGQGNNIAQHHTQFSSEKVDNTHKQAVAGGFSELRRLLSDSLNNADYFVNNFVWFKIINLVQLGFEIVLLKSRADACGAVPPASELLPPQKYDFDRF